MGVLNMAVFLTTLGLVFAAELGDKTQLLAMAFATKYKTWKVILGVLSAVVLLNLIAVLLGSYATSIIPLNVIRIIAALIFVIFGFLNLRNDKQEESEKKFKFGAVVTVALTFFIGELGDKTQLMTITMAAQYNSPYAVFFGSVLGMIACDCLGIIIGSTVLKKIPQWIVKLITSCIFIFFGFVGLYKSLLIDYIPLSGFIAFMLFILIAILSIYLYYNNNSSRNKTRATKS